MILVAAAGQKPSSGYAMTITSAVEAKGEVTVSVDAMSPGSKCVGLTVMTSPVDLARVTRRDGPVRFNVARRTRDCCTSSTSAPLGSRHATPTLRCARRQSHRGPARRRLLAALSGPSRGQHTDYRIAINVKIADGAVRRRVHRRRTYEHPILDHEPVSARLPGAREQAGNRRLDFIRGNLFDRTEMKPLPANAPGFDNDLNEKIDRIMQRAISDEHALVYAFGQRWGRRTETRTSTSASCPGTASTTST